MDPKVPEFQMTPADSNQVKEATCETGLKTRVPPFIETDEVIKISTETGEYLGRA